MEWFKRQFTFDHLGVETYAGHVDRLREVPTRLEELTRGLSREVLTKRDGDKWSIQEQAGHLLDLEPLGMSRLDDFEAGVEMLHPADQQNRKTYEADHNTNDIENILTSFRQEREAFVRRLDGYDEDFIQRMAIHPRLKKSVRVIDLAYFIAEHDDHHLERVAELRRMFAGD